MDVRFYLSFDAKNNYKSHLWRENVIMDVITSRFEICKLHAFFSIYSLQKLKVLKERLKKNTTIRLDSCSSEDKCTVLHKAAKMGYTKIVEWLLQKHANPNIENELHQTPLEVAIQEKHDETAEILAKKMSKER